MNPVAIKAHQYLINYWSSGEVSRTTCLLRTTDKNSWEKEIEKIFKEYKIPEGGCRTIYYEDRTIFSFITSKGSALVWSSSLHEDDPKVVYGVPYFVT